MLLGSRYGDNDNNTPLGAAVCNGSIECERLLLAAGADKQRTLALYAPRDEEVKDFEDLRPEAVEARDPLQLRPSNWVAFQKLKFKLPKCGYTHM